MLVINGFYAVITPVILSSISFLISFCGLSNSIGEYIITDRFTFVMAWAMFVGIQQYIFTDDSKMITAYGMRDEINNVLVFISMFAVYVYTGHFAWQSKE